MSSAEAELYALTKGAASAIGMISLARDLGVELNCTIHSGASAALGIVQRQGIGKMRHLNVRYLWLQGRVRNKDIEVNKVAGQDNPADLMTKHLAAADMTKHLVHLGFRTEKTRAELAPELAKRGGLRGRGGLRQRQRGH